MKKKTYIKPESFIVDPHCNGDIMEGELHSVSGEIQNADGTQNSHFTSQDGTPDDEWWKEDETVMPTSIFDYQ